MLNNMTSTLFRPPREIPVSISRPNYFSASHFVRNYCKKVMQNRQNTTFSLIEILEFWKSIKFSFWEIEGMKSQTARIRFTLHSYDYYTLFYWFLTPVWHFLFLGAKLEDFLCDKAQIDQNWSLPHFFRIDVTEWLAEKSKYCS